MGENLPALGEDLSSAVSFGYSTIARPQLNAVWIARYRGREGHGNTTGRCSDNVMKWRL